MSDEVQRRLIEWGLSCRRESERLGLPRISQIQVMIEHVKREDRLRKGVRKTRRTDERVRTASGKQSQAARRPGPILNSQVLEIDHIVAGLPEWMQVTIIRRYLYGEPDRLACRDLRMPVGTYRLRCNAAIEYVAERLGLVCGNPPR